MRAGDDTSSGAGHTVLVVDDEQDVRAMVRSALESRGFQVLEAEDGEEALELVRRHGRAIDLVITDAVMPRMGGRELIWQISIHHPGLPVVMASGVLPLRDATTDMDVRPAALVSKPFDPRELLTVVQRLIGG